MSGQLLLSCKITHSCLRYLERTGLDLELLYEQFDWPQNYLRDPSSWLEAERMESLLKTIEELYGDRVLSDIDIDGLKSTGSDLFEMIAHSAPELRTWGALDSVLRIVPGVRELYLQPNRFLSSFISPQPIFKDLAKSEDSLSFSYAGFSERCPFTTRYLKGILEALPLFIGRPPARVTWKADEISIDWTLQQNELQPVSSPALDGIQTLGLQSETSLSPSLLRTIMYDLAEAQKELETTRLKLGEALAREEELKKVIEKIPTERATKSILLKPNDSDTASTEIQMALHEVNRLGDYFARAQQLVTLLKPMAKSSSGTQATLALLKRMAWDYVVEETPRAISHARDCLQQALVENQTEMPNKGANEKAPLPLFAHPLPTRQFIEKGPLL